jgi:UDP-2,3-diacylglucosamine hydrolase
MTTPAYFISDVHLTLNNGDWEQARRKRLFAFFDMVAQSGGSLFILGDFFDFWFEYKRVIPKDYFDILTQLQRLRKAGVEIHFVLGNHDYWTDKFLNDTLGIHIYPEDTEVTINGRRFYLTHGDGLLAEDRGYRIMRKILRSPLVTFLYRWFHPDLGIALAQSASRLSRKYNPPVAQEEQRFQELTGFARAHWNAGCDVVVIGHYHLNRLNTEPGGKSILCLGDWISHYTYGKFADGNLTLEPWPN